MNKFENPAAFESHLAHLLKQYYSGSSMHHRPMNKMAEPYSEAT